MSSESTFITNQENDLREHLSTLLAGSPQFDGPVAELERRQDTPAGVMTARS
jgi:hypothetical protein